MEPMAYPLVANHTKQLRLDPGRLGPLDQPGLFLAGLLFGRLLVDRWRGDVADFVNPVPDEAEDYQNAMGYRDITDETVRAWNDARKAEDPAIEVLTEPRTSLF